MLKITKDQDFVCRDDIEHWAVRILQLDINVVNHYYYHTKYDPRINILKDEFVEAYVQNKNVQRNACLQAIPKIVDDFSSQFINFEASIYSNKSMGLSEIQVKNLNTNAQTEFDFDEIEVNKVRDFFEEEILG